MTVNLHEASWRLSVIITQLPLGQKGPPAASEFALGLDDVMRAVGESFLRHFSWDESDTTDEAVKLALVYCTGYREAVAVGTLVFAEALEKQREDAQE